MFYVSFEAHILRKYRYYKRAHINACSPCRCFQRTMRLSRDDCTGVELLKRWPPWNECQPNFGPLEGGSGAILSSGEKVWERQTCWKGLRGGRVQFASPCLRQCFSGKLSVGRQRGALSFCYRASQHSLALHLSALRHVADGVTRVTIGRKSIISPQRIHSNLRSSGGGPCPAYASRSPSAGSAGFPS